jgi:hypothetical protein
MKKGKIKSTTIYAPQYLSIVVKHTPEYTTWITGGIK